MKKIIASILALTIVVGAFLGTLWGIPELLPMPQQGFWGRLFAPAAGHAAVVSVAIQWMASAFVAGMAAVTAGNAVIDWGWAPSRPKAVKAPAAEAPAPAAAEAPTAASDLQEVLEAELVDPLAAGQPNPTPAGA
jgi:hypothetical protein